MTSNRHTLRLGTLAGVPIGVQPLWMVIVALITFSLGHDYFPNADRGLSSTAAYGLGLLSALGLFGGILLHELGHAIAARRRGLVVDEIDLWLLGGMARMHGEPKAPGDELRFAIAGPAVTLAILVVLGAVRLAVGTAGASWIQAAIDYQLYVSAAILVFNMIPAFPLDGGRVLRAALWLRSGDQRLATHRAARVGRGFGFVLVAFGLMSFAGGGGVGGLWFLLVGGFLVMAATAEEQGSATARALAGLTIADVMAIRPATIEARTTLEEAITDDFARLLFTAFPVVDHQDRALGLLSLTDVRDVPQPDRRSTAVSEVMDRDPELLIAADRTVAELLTRPAFARRGRAVAVDSDGLVVGIVSTTDLQRRLRAADLTTPTTQTV